MPERRRFPLSRATRPIRPPIYTASLRHEATLHTPKYAPSGGFKMDLSPIGGPADLALPNGAQVSMFVHEGIAKFLTTKKQARNVHIDTEEHPRLIFCEWETPPRYSAKIRSYWAARNVRLPE